MNNRPVTRLGAVGYELGTAQALQCLAAPDRSALAGNPASGQFERYLHAQARTAYDLALAAIDKTLAVCELAPHDIDLVIFATDSFVSVRQTMLFFQQLAATRGLDAAYPVIVSMSECANFHSALDVAWQATLCGRARTVLLVTIDLADTVSPGTRVVGNGIGIMSDAAASCIVSLDLAEGLVLQAVDKRIRAQLGAATLAPQQDLMVRLETNSLLFDHLFATAGASPLSIRKVMPSNLSLPMLTTFLGEAGFVQDQIYSNNHRRIAHCLASDCLINLHDYVLDEAINKGERFVLYGLGPVTWGGALLQADQALCAL